MSDNFLKKSLRTNSITSGVYNKIRELYHIKKNKKAMKLFEDKSIEVLHKTQFDLAKYNQELQFFFAYGTLLGIIRDNKLLKRDMDIDIIVLWTDNIIIDEFRKYMNEKKYKRVHSFYIEDIGVVQDSFVSNDILIDIHYARVKNGRCETYLLYSDEKKDNAVIIFPFSKQKITEYTFAGNHVFVPLNPDLFLKETYGDEWRIPNPHYKYWENRCAIKTELLGKTEKISYET